MKCPTATRNAELNGENQSKAIEKVAYGPANIDEPNEEFWAAKADNWNIPITEAKKRLCGNCSVFNQSPEMMDCIREGNPGAADLIESKAIGYCESLGFMCSSKRTCDVWAPRDEAKRDPVDLYLQRTQKVLLYVQHKSIRTGSFVEWNSSGGKARGRVEHVMKEGVLGIPDSSFSINASEDDPAVLIRIWREGAGGWNETETLVGHRMSTLTSIEPLSKKSLEEKARTVRNAAYWGMPVGTPITPGMKPVRRTIGQAGGRSASLGAIKHRSADKFTGKKPQKNGPYDIAGIESGLQKFSDESFSDIEALADAILMENTLDETLTRDDLLGIIKNEMKRREDEDKKRFRKNRRERPRASATIRMRVRDIAEGAVGPKDESKPADKDESYRGAHKAPNREYGGAMSDPTEFFPDDIYGPNALKLYGTGFEEADRQSLEVIQRVKGNPDSTVTIYRAVPADYEGPINPGDWVTPSIAYARQHGEGPMGGNFKIIKEVVRAGDLFTEANSLNEWGYDPEPGK